MKTIKLISIVSVLFLSNQSFATLPQQNNKLYTQTAKNCVSINLNSLKKDQKTFLVDHQFKVEKIQECNNREFPVYLGRTQYDLTYQTNVAYAQKFFTALAELNKKTNFALVDTFSKKIFYINVQNKPFEVSYTIDNY